MLLLVPLHFTYRFRSTLHHYPAMHLLQLLLQWLHNQKVSSTLPNSTATFCYSESCLSYEMIANFNHILYLAFCDINSSLSSFHSVLPTSNHDGHPVFPLHIDSKVNLAREIRIKYFEFLRIKLVPTSVP